MKVTFYLMTEKGLHVLQSAIDAGFASLIDKVITNTDAAVANDFSAEITALAQKHNIPCERFSADSTAKSDYSIVVSWRWLIRESASKLIVFHDSLLPKYRGFAPLVNALINGEKEIGVTALFASADYDRGGIISQMKIPVIYPTTIQQAITAISDVYSKLALDLLDKIKNNDNLVAMPQAETEATYSLWRDEQDYHIDWNQNAATIERFVNAVGFPYAGAQSGMDGHKITIHSVSLREDVAIENRTAGKVIFTENGKPVVVCGKGLLRIEDAVYHDSGESIFPLKKFRIRFTSL